MTAPFSRYPTPFPLAGGGFLPLGLSGDLGDYVQGMAYEQRLTISNPRGKCTVKVLSATNLPAGAQVFVDNFEEEVVVRWPAYAEPASVSVPNGDFDLGDDGTWLLGAGWTIEDERGETEDPGDYGAVYRGAGTARITSAAKPIGSGASVTATAQIQQGSSANNNVIANVGIEYLNNDGDVVATHHGNVVSSGSDGDWHPSTVTAVSPSSGFVRVFITATRKSENKPLAVDNVTWNYGGSAGYDGTDDVCLSLQVKDAMNRTAEWSDCIGNVEEAVFAAVRHWWTCNETGAATVVADATGTADLTLLNKPSITFGGAAIRSGGGASMRFTGLGRAQSSIYPAWVINNEAYSVAAWIKLDTNTSTDNRDILSDGPTSDASAALNYRIRTGVRFSGGPYSFWEYGTGTDYIVDPGVVIGTGAHLLIVTRDPVAQEVVFYIDGVELDRITYTQDPTDGNDASKRLVLGNVQEGNRPFLGYLQDVAVFERPLTPAEAVYLYNAGAGRSYADIVPD